MEDLIKIEQLLNIANQKGAFTLVHAKQAISSLENLNTILSKMQSQIEVLEKEVDNKILKESPKKDK